MYLRQALYNIAQCYATFAIALSDGVCCAVVAEDPQKA